MISIAISPDRISRKLKGIGIMSPYLPTKTSIGFQRVSYFVPSKARYRRILIHWSSMRRGLRYVPCPIK